MLVFVMPAEVRKTSCCVREHYCRPQLLAVPDPHDGRLAADAREVVGYRIQVKWPERVGSAARPGAAPSQGARAALTASHALGAAVAREVPGPGLIDGEKDPVASWTPRPSEDPARLRAELELTHVDPLPEPRDPLEIDEAVVER